MSKRECSDYPKINRVTTLESNRQERERYAFLCEMSVRLNIACNFIKKNYIFIVCQQCDEFTNWLSTVHSPQSTACHTLILRVEQFSSPGISQKGPSVFRVSFESFERPARGTRTLSTSGILTAEPLRPTTTW